MLSGARATQQEVRNRAAQQLKVPQYNDIGLQYTQLYGEVMYSDMANADLEKYNKALEKALLVFHTTKMSDINKIVKELWQKTYRGQDIDYVQIKADADGARNYNYRYEFLARSRPPAMPPGQHTRSHLEHVCFGRVLVEHRVVMYNGGAELEMRGRCSAGQKVLACLIIRLALAETFCLNCGILALDEPTTNLDRENSASLAEALRAIMLARKEQENFQLIVITHDEAFAHQIGTREHADYLWRVTKDDAQHSHLEREEIDG
uniref:DNA repair protein RAD50 n=1 Tax=Haematococcus lacustris TaxID=44745 RepID=A0A699Z921_HAELA